MIDRLENHIKQLNQIIDFEDPYSKKQQIKLLQEIITNPSGLKNLLEILVYRKSNHKQKISSIDGTIFKYLYNSKILKFKHELSKYFQYGIFSLESDNNINYIPLYECLISDNFKKANHLTQIYLNQLAGLNENSSRKWLYFTDVMNFPIKDLKTIDSLWCIYSGNQFGFSIQRKIWIYHNKNWEKLWQQIGWKINEKNIRYPNEFIWNINAPIGHLPLSNQLRGSQVLTAIFMHPAIQIEFNE